MYPEELTLHPAAGSLDDASLAAAVTHAASAELADALATIEHCVGQLSDDQVWHRQGGAAQVGNFDLVGKVVSVGCRFDSRIGPAIWSAGGRCRHTCGKFPVGE